jgi:hypothetical protein
MEALMARRTDHPSSLEVQESFETTRLGPQCLVDAYTRLVPIQRQTPRRADHVSPRPVVVAASRRGGEHG